MGGPMLEHISEEGTPHERGLRFGEAQRSAVHGTLAAYERIFQAACGLNAAAVASFGDRVGERLRAAHPDALEEIAAIARGAGVDEALLLAVNARTELLAGASAAECSAIGVVPERSGGHTLLAQNWDWNPDLRDSVVLWTIVEPDGRWLVTMTEAGMLAKIGLNSRGLGLCLNILGSSADGGPDGIPLHVLMRLALQRCDDVATAGALLEGTEVSGSSCFNLGDAKGALASYEVSPAGVSRIEPEHGVLLHTNHFLRRPGDVEDVHGRDSPSTLARFDELERRVRRAPSEIDAAAVKEALRSHDAAPNALCCHDPDNERYADRAETLVSVCLDLHDLRFEISDGAPCGSPYREAVVPGSGVARAEPQPL
jgi:isopenicillin-N N-acyltransferase-like protein